MLRLYNTADAWKCLTRNLAHKTGVLLLARIAVGKSTCWKPVAGLKDKPETRPVDAKNLKFQTSNRQMTERAQMQFTST